MFAQRLKEMRNAKKVSQEKLANLLGISQQAVGKWEQGKSTPDPTAVGRIAEFFGVSSDFLLGLSDLRRPAASVAGVGYDPVSIPIIGSVRAGYGALAYVDDCGSAVAHVRDPANYFYLMVRGDSMEPKISEGDLALVRRQSDVESGQLAVVIVNGEEGTLKKVIKRDGAVILQPFNPAYPAQIFMGEDLDNLQIVGQVTETKTMW